MAARGQSQGQGEGGPTRSFSFPEGLEELPRALAAKLGARRRIGVVAALEPTARGWRVQLESGAPVEADHVVLTTPARVTAKLLEPHAPGAALALASVPHAPIAVAALGFRTQDLGMDLEAYGFIAARGEGVKTLGCQYESSIFAHRAPPGATLLRTLHGGTFEPDIVDAPDDAIAAQAVGDLRRVAGLRVDPDFVAVWRHPLGIPQYDLAHSARLRAIEDALRSCPGLHVLGQATSGVGVNDGIAAAAAFARGIA
jgi:oxygen-dependent protoporphyrinogen oxidase